MTETTQTRHPAGEDAVLPFAVEPLDVRGRTVKMGPVLDAILNRHDYPEAVNRLLAEAIVLTAMLGSTLKFEGRLTLQAQTDGPVSVLVVDFQAPDGLRATAQFDADKVAQAAAKEGFKPDDLLGRGHLAFTIDQGSNTSRYQGIVVLEGTTLEEAAHEYFFKSEQIPTRVRLGVAQLVQRREGNSPQKSWRAGGIMLQFLPKSEERQRQADLHPGDAPEGHDAQQVAEDDAWMEAKALVDTVKDEELTNTDLSAEGLLYRLFHERGVKAFDPQMMQDRCTCSQEKISAMLRQMPEPDQQEMLAEGVVEVNCDFCSKHYKLDPRKILG
ncbi:Hsp33 family molecular chaperone [Polycladidibacter hongkongensis]|uniref:Hsp33 family molecular chaperone n=1 Tax=Polycladidibacter hongkongensis TaxID=1647556 RepID=UPI00082982E0|nr:Hsp33 family molecular chaperone [Pseudovibrio hongkongensis]